LGSYLFIYLFIYLLLLDLTFLSAGISDRITD